MNIALISHDAKKELMVQFCIAYCGILSRHNLCATGTTGKMVSEATGLTIQKFLSGSQKIRGIYRAETATSRSRRASPAMRWTCSCFSGIPWIPNPMSLTTSTCSASAICIISRWLPTLLPPRF